LQADPPEPVALFRVPPVFAIAAGIPPPLLSKPSALGSLLHATTTSKPAQIAVPTKSRCRSAL
jgi:hypothetical protein